ncbi:MAG: PLDc N-terminal domain-containing protein [Acidimicrobiales bacterium]
MLLAYDYPLLDVFVSIVAFAFLAIWLFLLVIFIADLFRDRELSGPVKATWLLFLIVLPYIGTITYVVLRGSGMSARQIERGQQQDSAFWSAFDDTSGLSGGAPA